MFTTFMFGYSVFGLLAVTTFVNYLGRLDFCLLEGFFLSSSEMSTIYVKPYVYFHWAEYTFW